VDRPEYFITLPSTRREQWRRPMTPERLETPHDQVFWKYQGRNASLVIRSAHAQWSLHGDI